VKRKNGLTYEKSGVVGLEGLGSFDHFLYWIKKTMKNHPEVKTEIGLYATILKIAPNLGVAMSTDGVGTKLLIAEMMNKYDTVGIDCIAMNVNDIICVGARPIAMLDYIGIQDVRKKFLADLGKGLYRGAVEAGISIPAGEIAQLKEMLRGIHEGMGFDLVGCAVGVVDMDKIIVGDGIKDGDVVVGLASSGLHSNGYTLARKVLLSKFKVGQYLKELGRTVGEELLEPTRIYVRPAMKMLDEKIKVKAFLHITGEGFRNLRRVRSQVGFELDNLFPAPAVFRLIQRQGGISQEEMANTFNMGVGLAVVVSEKDASRVIAVSRKFKIPAQVIGRAFPDRQKQVVIPSMGVVGRESRFHPLD
jgi:phosphoribosylformylglycinamidine cyclo-ligase